MPIPSPKFNRVRGRKQVNYFLKAFDTSEIKSPARVNGNDLISDIALSSCERQYERLILYLWIWRRYWKM